MPENMQERIGRDRPPRVHITYGSETGGAREAKEIPFVVGVLADLSGHHTPTHTIEDREFYDLDSDSFRSLFKEARPCLSLSVPNLLHEDPGVDDKPIRKAETHLSCELQLDSLEAFDPSHVACQISPLNELLRVRATLNEFNAYLQMTPNLEDELQTLLEDPINVEQLRREFDLDTTPNRDRLTRLSQQLNSNNESPETPATQETTGRFDPGDSGFEAPPSSHISTLDRTAEFETPHAWKSADPPPKQIALLDCILKRTSGRPENREKRTRLIATFVSEVLAGSPLLRSASSRLPAPGGNVARFEVPSGPDGNRGKSADPCAQRKQDRLVAIV